jgi:hypothetical protein
VGIEQEEHLLKNTEGGTVMEISVDDDDDDVDDDDEDLKIWLFLLLQMSKFCAVESRK